MKNSKYILPHAKKFLINTDLVLINCPFLNKSFQTKIKINSNGRLKSEATHIAISHAYRI